MSARSHFADHFDVSRETLHRLDAYVALLAKWNKAINLIGRSTLPDVWARHLTDSAQVFALLPNGAKTWADLGSGGGLPGLVVAIMAHEPHPDLQVTCVESDQRKATFLRSAVRELGLNTSVVAKRIEAIPDIGADVISARALAPLTNLLSLTHRHLGTEGRAIFLKGSSYLQEIEEAKHEWAFDIQAIPSKTDQESAVLILGGIRRA